MPSAKYALEPNGPKRLELKWGAFWKNLTITLDAREIGTIPNKDALTQGQTFALGDGTSLTVQLETGMQPMLKVLRDGQPLPGSASDPQAMVRGGAGVFFFVAAITIFFGLLGMAGVEIFANMGLNLGTVIEGLIFAVLGYFAWRGSLAALVTGFVLMIVDQIVTIAASVGTGHPATGGIIMRIFLLMAVWRGIQGARALAKNPPVPSSTATPGTKVDPSNPYSPPGT